MPRRDFSSMLGNLDPNDKPLTAVADVEPDAPTTKSETDGDATQGNTAPAKKGSASRSKATKRVTAAKTTTGVAGGVGYDQLERKETRLHEHQYSELTTTARRLNKQRQGEGHRITENTLIRLGIDLLLQRAEELHGATEADLARSLGLP